MRRPSADHDERVRYRYLAAERALNHSFARTHGKARALRGPAGTGVASPPSPRIHRRENSRPTVVGSSRRVTLASTDSHFAVLVTPPHYDIAIDIERHDPNRHFDALADITMTGRERRRFDSLYRRDRRQAILYFYRVWTIAEAVTKLGAANILGDAPFVESDAGPRRHTETTDLGTALKPAAANRSAPPRKKRPVRANSGIYVPTPRIALGSQSIRVRKASFRGERFHVTTVRLCDASLTISAASSRPLPSILLVNAR